MISSGKVKDISWTKGTWLILDVGFSSSRKTCGIILGDNKADKLKFNDATDEVVRIARNKSLLNLVIEAPLSVAFDRSGNPKARSIEKEGGKNRLWYVGPGCAVLVAAMYLMKKLYDSHPSAEIRLFEGFVSYKSKATRSGDVKDVELLRKAIKARRTPKHHIIRPEELTIARDDNIRSAFELMDMKDMDFGIPPVIKVDG
jgi:hypothetical protein